MLLTYEIETDEINGYRSALHMHAQESSLKLTDNQLSACETALTHRVCVITGGPGTGKTSIMKAILTAYRMVHEDARIFCLAPTGKAASRLGEACSQPASTMHSLLLSVRKGELLPAGLYVIDESSMIDQMLAEKFLNRIDLNSIIIFIGDPDQLPSVGAGAFLLDLIKSQVIPVCTLTEVFRQEKNAGRIIENADKINHGQSDLQYDDHFEFINVTSEEEALQALLPVWHREVSRWGIKNVAVLCPLRRKRLLSSDSLNRILQEEINPKGVESVTADIHGTQFRMNDRVMQMKNTDAASNGDVGTIITIGQENDSPVFRIAWDNGSVSAYDIKDMGNVTLAYAMSIHKAQGSQYRSVIIPLVKEEACALYRRNLLYTAVTRASEYVCLLSDPVTVDMCVRTADRGTRLTLFADRLRKRME